MTVDVDRVFQIPSCNFSTFQTKWNKLIRRANKLGVTVPSYTLIKEEPRTRKVRKQRFNEDTGRDETYEDEVVILYHHITIQHELVIVNGWQFIATLEHTAEGNITHNISGKDLPTKYRDCDAFCDHCKLKRNRKDTFVVANDVEFKQIGSSCLRDFLGVDGTSYANAAEIYGSADELAGASENDDGDNWGRGESYDYLDQFLSHVAEVISIEGWRSKKTANEQGGRSTSEIAYDHMHPGPFQKAKDRLYDQPSEKSIELAKASIEWCEELSDIGVEASEYLHNIRTIARRQIIGSKQYGYAASIVSGYQRTLVDRVNKEKQAVSKHVGVVGKRQMLAVFVERVLQFDGTYGTTHMHFMRDADYNRFVWKSSSTVLDIGSWVCIKASIKDHSDYKGVLQTTLTRCQVVNVPMEANHVPRL